MAWVATVKRRDSMDQVSLTLYLVRATKVSKGRYQACPELGAVTVAWSAEYRSQDPFTSQVQEATGWQHALVTHSRITSSMAEVVDLIARTPNNTPRLVLKALDIPTVCATDTCLELANYTQELRSPEEESRLNQEGLPTTPPPKRHI